MVMLGGIEVAQWLILQGTSSPETDNISCTTRQDFLGKMCLPDTFNNNVTHPSKHNVFLVLYCVCISVIGSGIATMEHWPYRQPLWPYHQGISLSRDSINSCTIAMVVLIYL